MPDIHIIVPDAALRGAIAEGVKLAGFGEAHESGDVAATLSDPDTTAIFLDESAADKKSLKAFRDAPTGEKKRRIFLLGEADAAWADHMAVESFPKPMRLGHLLARLSFHLRTRPKLQNKPIVFGPWRLELQNRQIVRQDDESVIRLTEKETAVLDYLAQSETSVGREELLAAVWGHDGRIDTHTLETHIYQLRRKLDPDGKGVSLLVNEQGAYRLKDS